MSRAIFIHREGYWEAIPFDTVRKGDRIKVFDSSATREFEFLPVWIADTDAEISTKKKIDFEIQAHQTDPSKTCLILDK